MDVAGKVALITGGARGMGKAYAERLLEKKAKVTITDILKESGHSTERELQEKFGKDNVIFLFGDVTNQDSMEHVFAKTIEKFGGLHIVINNAGVLEAAEDPIYQINQFGVVRCTELAQRKMRKDQGGQGGVIINIGSIAGLYNIPVLSPAYISSKHAVVGYTSNLGSWLDHSQGIRIAAICPGFAPTDLVARFADLDQRGDKIAGATIKACGGWTPIERMVSAMVKIVETDLPNGALVRAAAAGLFLVNHGPDSTDANLTPISAPE